MCNLVTQDAPDFTAQAVMPDNSFAELKLSSYRGKYVVLFFYPLDFTFVCPTELLAFQKRLGDFEKRDVAVVGCSVDSQFSHWRWLTTEKKDGAGETLIYILAHKDKQAQEDSFKAFRADPRWVKAKGDSEVNGPLTAKDGVLSQLMAPTDFSPAR